MERKIYENPRIKDRVVFLQTSEETNGAYTLVEVELAVGGGNGLHYHSAFSEEFTAVEGALGIQVENKKLILQPGESAIAPLGKLHRFYNPGNQPIKFHVKLEPGHEGFEQGLKIAYGLAGDNLTNKSGVPKNMSHLAIIMSLTNTGLPGFLGFISPLLLWKAKKAIKKGVAKELIEQYA